MPAIQTVKRRTNTLNQLKKWLLYAGLDKEEFDALLPAAVEENRRSLRIYALIALGLFLALVIVNAFSNGFAKINMTSLPPRGI